MKNFVTGSRAYGLPKDNSDIDLVCFVDHDTLQQLRNLADPENKVDPTKEMDYFDFCSDKSTSGYPDTDDRMSLRFGSLNLICVTDINEFNMWFEATNELIKLKPVTRDFAVSYFEQKRKNLLLSYLK